MVIHVNATVAAITPHHDPAKQILGCEILAAIIQRKRNQWQHGERFAQALAIVRDAADSGRDCLAELSANPN